MGLGRILMLAGLVLLVLGAVVVLVQRSNIPLGRLPGDVTWRGKNTTVYFPWVTCLLLSALVSIILWLFNRR